MTPSKTVSGAVLKRSIFLIFILAIPLGGLLLLPPIIKFQQDIDSYRSTYIEEVKQNTKNQIEQTIMRLSFDHRYVKIRMKTRLREQVFAAHAIANEVYEQNKNKVSDTELRSIVRETLRVMQYNDGRGYFFAADFDGIAQLFADKPELEGKNLLGMQGSSGKHVIRDMIEIARSRAGEGFYDYTWSKPGAEETTFSKLSFIKHFKPFDWYIGTGEYLDVTETQIKAEAVEWLDHVKYGKDNYVFAFEYGGTYVAHVGKNVENKSDHNYWHLKDVNGVLINQELQRMALQGGGFFEYVWHKPSTGKATRKIAYVEAFEPWGWVIGTGVYLDDIEETIDKKKATLWKTTRKNTVLVGIILTIALLISLVIAMLFAKSLRKELAIFQRFFKKAVSESEKMAVEQLHYDGFQNLARAGNDVLAEREKAEEALKKSHEFLETMSDIAYTADKEGNLVWANAALEKLSGISPKEAMGKPFLPLFIQSDHASLVDIYSRTLQGESLENTLTFTNGVTCLFSSLPRLNEAGETVGTFGIARDITERKHAEEEILKFRTIADKAVHGSAIVELDGTIVYVNDSFAQTHGYTTDELVGKKLSIFHTDKQFEEVFRINENLAKNGSYSALEVWHVHKDGTEFPMLMSAVIVEDENKNPLYLAATAIDITERKVADEKLRLQALVLDQISDHVTITDLKGVITYVNQAQERLFQKDSAKLVGHTTESYGEVPEQGATQKEILEKTLKDGFWHGEVVNKKTDGTNVVMNCRTEIISDKNGESLCLVGIATDISEKKNAEKEKAMLEAQVHQAQKMESVGRLAGGVAHDFNNLLTGITGNVQLAQMDINPGDPLYEMLGEIKEASDRAADLTRQLLAFSRKQIIAPKVINLNDLIKNMYKMLGRIIGEDVEIKIIPMKQLGQVKADPGQVEQIITNFAVNARDAMPDGGKLTIETADISLDEEYCKLHPQVEPGEYVMLAISDNGEGMDEETQNHIFDPFFTTKAEGQGTGLGLATVYGIIKQHDGHVEVYSKMGEGTTFKVYFPLVHELAEAVTRTSPLSDLPHGTETVFIVEDESMVKNVAIKILTRLGYKVLSANDGVHALSDIKKSSVQIDLLLTDVVMPKMNGRELAEELQKQFPEIKVLFTSGYTEDVIAHHGMLDEGLDFIGKPYTPQALGEKVRKVLDGS